MSPKRLLLAGAIAVALGVVAFLLYHSPTTEVPAPPPPVQRVHDSTTRLDNGLHVDVVACEICESFAVVLRVGVGAEHDPEGRSGLAFVIERLLAPAAGNPSQRTLSVGAEATIYSAVASPAHLETELEHAAALLAKLDANDDAVAQARDAVTQEIQQRQGDDAVATAIGFAKESAHASRAKAYLGGLADAVADITTQDVDAHWKAYFKPAGARLAVVGKVELAAAAALVQKLFGSIEKGERAKLGPSPGAAVRGTLVMGSEPTALALAVAPPAPSDATFPAFLVLATRVARGAGSWSFEYDPLQSPGTLLLSGALSGGERPEPAAERLRKQIDEAITPPLGPADVEAVRDRFGATLGLVPLDPALCKKDALGVALGRAGRAALGIDASALSTSLASLTEAQLDEARALFAPKRTSAVGAGGPIQ